jgi:predicted nucleotidyltransferase
LKDIKTKDLRTKVAKEAALLLYTSQEKEFKQAKLRALSTLGIRVLPSNREIAWELDKIAEEREGLDKNNLLIRMRHEAEEIMEDLQDLHPVLIGSVWRGTARKNSDIDIYVFSENPGLVLDKLQRKNYRIKISGNRSVTKMGQKQSSFHIQILLKSGDIAEIVVRHPNFLYTRERCEIYGDIKTGLNINQLKKILKNDPLQKFIPF